MIKLWDIPQKSKIYCQASDGSSWIMFHHLDGMYSFCTTEKGGVCHLAGGTPLIIEKDGYKIENG